MRRLVSIEPSYLIKWLRIEIELNKELRTVAPQERDRFLTGLRILDLADERASFGSKLLADLGAEVIKIEKPGGDPSRKIGPFAVDLPGSDDSFFFQYHNANKRGVTLNLESESGRNIFKRLLEKADVVIESFEPGRLKGLGLNFEVLSRVNPRLILVSVTGFGQTGPRRNYKSCDLVAVAYGGQMSVTGLPDSPPLKAFGEQSYYTASILAASGVLLALRKRAKSGKGEHVDISAQESIAAGLDYILVRYFYDKVVSTRRGNIHWNNSFCVLPCKDGHILLSPFHQWEILIEWMASEGRAGDLKDEKWLNEDYRRQNFNCLLEVLTKWTLTHTRKELFELGQLMRLPWAPVCSIREVLESPQLKERRFFLEVDRPRSAFSAKQPGLPFSSSLGFPKRSRPAPMIGEHNSQVYGEELGLPAEELQRLAQTGVI